MKKKIAHCCISVLVIAFLACTSDDSNTDGSDNLNSQLAAITDLVTSGSWVINSFVDSGVDETDDFGGYVFTFNADGSLIADNGSSTVEGSWSITSDDNDDSSDDDSDSDSDDLDFNIFFASPANFSELTEDWDIVSQSGTVIDLIHVSGGNGGTDTLTFERN